jgi:hypothetical protein
VRFRHFSYALASGERFRWGDCGLGLHEYADQPRGVLLGEYAGELQNAGCVAAPIDEDDDLAERGAAVIKAQRYRLGGRRLPASHSYLSFSKCIHATGRLTAESPVNDQKCWSPSFAWMNQTGVLMLGLMRTPSELSVSFVHGTLSTQAENSTLGETDSAVNGITPVRDGHDLVSVLGHESPKAKALVLLLWSTLSASLETYNFGGLMMGPFPSCTGPFRNVEVHARAWALTKFELLVRSPQQPNVSEDTAATVDLRIVLKCDPLSNMVRDSVHRNRAMALIATTFGLFVGLLAMIGVYGVTSHATAERTREIGIRMALGATRRGVFRMLLGEMMRMVCIGVVLGLGAVYPAAQMIRSGE